MSLKLGSINTIVISSPEVAKEMFTKHDLALSSRNVPYAATRVANHDKLSVGWLPVCPKWRNLRKIIAIQLFTTQRLDASQALRQEKVNELVEYACHCCEKGVAVDIGKAGFITTLNLLSNTLFSIDLASHTSSHSGDFKDLVSHLWEELVRPNLADIFPLLKPFDVQGTMKRFDGYLYKVMGVFEEIIDHRLKDMDSAKDDVLNTLLKPDAELKLSREEIKYLIVDLFVAGTESTSITLEWAMTELLHNPERMARAQSEINQVVGENELVQESDTSKLPYIQAIVKETLRLHPPALFLVPHKAEEEDQLCGYHIPKNSQVLVNVWSIGRDPSIWLNPLSFEPERFLKCEIDTKGRHFELIPFGAGRRMCPAISLANRMLHLTLATLIHSFNWKHANALGPEDIDVEEKFAIALHKLHPLLAIPLTKQSY